MWMIPSLQSPEAMTLNRSLARSHAPTHAYTITQTNETKCQQTNKQSNLGEEKLDKFRCRSPFPSIFSVSLEFSLCCLTQGNRI